MSATQRQKFHTDDANQCLHNKSGSHGVPNINLSNFACLLVDFGEVLCSSANELQQNSNTSSREDYIPQILTVLSEIRHIYTWPLWPFVFCLSRLSFVNNSWNNVTTPSTNKRFWPDFGQILCYQYGISVFESQTFLRAKRPQWWRARRNGCFRRLLLILDCCENVQPLPVHVLGRNPLTSHHIRKEPSYSLKQQTILNLSIKIFI